MFYNINVILIKLRASADLNCNNAVCYLPEFLLAQTVQGTSLHQDKIKLSITVMSDNNWNRLSNNEWATERYH